MLNPERIESIEQVEREFFVSPAVRVAVKRKGFNTWCRLPYPKHPAGCPNFGIREDCPPNQPYFLDVYKPRVKVAALRFDFGNYMRFRMGEHPNWTERAIRNPRHFQNHLDANLRREVNNLKKRGYIPVFSAEAMGVNMHLTCARAGIQLEWPPKENMYRIVILARPKTNVKN